MEITSQLLEVLPIVRATLVGRFCKGLFIQRHDEEYDTRRRHNPVVSSFILGALFFLMYGEVSKSTFLFYFFRVTEIYKIYL